ncbi:MAG TPA: hypothetical protein VFS00_13605, partial [Polyangiaceae bacterium]|nr:hypothetical protein [Polyangiaceae bacterium]
RRPPLWRRPTVGATLVASLLGGAGCNQAPPEPSEAGAPAPRAPAADAASREAQARTLADAIRPHVDRSPGAAKTTARPGGGVRADLGESYQSVVIAKRNADGSSSTTCVDDANEAEAFWRTGEAPAAHAGGDR